MYTIHATKKLLDRVKQPVSSPVSEPSTVLGNWYATAIFWKPQQAALFMNERALLPVLLPLAPAVSLADRFPDQLGLVLEVLGMPVDFVSREVGAMGEVAYAKTVNRSLLTSLSAFAQHADRQRDLEAEGDFVALSARLSRMPCGPLYEGQFSPDRELASAVFESLDW
ncbi:DUF6933 domain-containing protein [Candidatus Poriferisocius sp.]|uniref:DUF6933 domain-containing protein n=1 Tax=Candidatus Poriferisocius sp. TaxID=3101276 RepID=UPI003B017D51